MAATAPLQNLLRTVFLGMLMFGLLVRPALSLACEISDSRHALVTQHADDGVLSALSVDDGASADCCTTPGCGDCCSHAAAAVMQVEAVGAMLSSVCAGTATVVDFRPAPPGVDLRPPINA